MPTRRVPARVTRAHRTASARSRAPLHTATSAGVPGADGAASPAHVASARADGQPAVLSGQPADESAGAATDPDGDQWRASEEQPDAAAWRGGMWMAVQMPVRPAVTWVPAGLGLLPGAAVTSPIGRGYTRVYPRALMRVRGAETCVHLGAVGHRGVREAAVDGAQCKVESASLGARGAQVAQPPPTLARVVGSICFAWLHRIRFP